MRSKILAVAVALLALAAAVTSGVCVEFADSIELTVLMYHHIAQDGDSDVTVSTDRFDEHLSFLTEQGYSPVGFDELAAYVNDECELPERCVAIVFDDGYRSNFELAFPILKSHNMKATISLIGSSVGCDTYKDTGVPILPYLDWNMAREMRDSGLVAFASHTYDMHMSPDFEQDPLRLAAIPLPGESDEHFERLFRDDWHKNRELFERELGYAPEVFAYPTGKFTHQTERILRSLGAKATLITKIGRNRITKGDAESLYLIRRFNINDATTTEMIAGYLSGIVY